MESTNNQKPIIAPQPKPQVPMYMVAIIVTLSVLAVVLGLVLYQSSQKLNKAKEDISFVEDQKSHMEGELNEIIVGYDSLRTENDSINERLTIEQDKIRRLLKVQASNSKKLELYQKELGTLRKVMRSYIVQIDSLNTRNRELTEENVAVRTELKQKSDDFEQLSETAEVLSSKVAYAQKLTAKDILAEGLNDRSKPKNKVDKIAKIRVCLTIRENNIANAGSKMIYLRITRPDNVVLSSSEAGMFSFKGEELIYSAKRELDYDNMDIDMCIFWDNTEELIPGNYGIALYAEGYEIGSTSIELQ
jgi:chromosome segregation ATPase